MAVNEHVNAGDLLQQINGAVGGSGGLIVNAQVAQADDVVAPGLGQLVNLRLGHSVHILAGGELHANRLAGVALGLGLGGVQTEHAQLDAVLGLKDDVVAKGQLAVIGDVGGQDGELSGPGQLGQVLIAVVELVVAGGGRVVAGHVHQLNGNSALGGAHRGLALAEVAGVHHQNIRAGLLVQGLQRGHLGVALDGAVDVVGVENDDRAVSLRRYLKRGGRSAVRVAARVLVRHGADGHAKGHNHRQQKREQLVPLSHIGFPPKINLSGQPPPGGCPPGEQRGTPLSARFCH